MITRNDIDNLKLQADKLGLVGNTDGCHTLRELCQAWEDAENREDQIGDLKSTVEAAEEERDELDAENTSMLLKNRDLQKRIDALEDTLKEIVEQLQKSGDAVTVGGVIAAASEALSS